MTLFDTYQRQREEELRFHDFGVSARAQRQALEVVAAILRAIGGEVTVQPVLMRPNEEMLMVENPDGSVTYRLRERL